MNIVGNGTLVRNGVIYGGSHDTEAVHWSEASKSVKKNLLPNNIVSQTINGLTVTKNADDSVTINGTATAFTVLDVATNNTSKKLALDAGTYLITDGLSEHSVNLYTAITITTTGGTIDYNRGHTNGQNQFVVNAGETLMGAGIVIASGETVSNLTFKPMIRLASIADSTYVPFIYDNIELAHMVEDVQSIDLSSIVTPNPVLFDIVYAGVVLRNGIAVLSLRVKCLNDIASSTGYNVVTGLPYIPLAFDNKNIECIGRNITQDNIGVMAWFSGSTPGSIDTTGGTMAGTLLEEDDVISFTTIYPYVVNS